MAPAQATELNDLIETLKDSEQNFAVAAEDSSRAGLKKFFEDLSQQRAGFASALQELVEDAGESAEETGSTSGALRRGWMELKATFSFKGDVTLLEECERAEGSAIERYRQTLAGDLPAAARRLVERQFQQVLDAYDQLKRFHDAAHTAATAR